MYKYFTSNDLHKHSPLLPPSIQGKYYDTTTRSNHFIEIKLKIEKIVRVKIY